MQEYCSTAVFWAMNRCSKRHGLLASCFGRIPAEVRRSTAKMRLSKPTALDAFIPKPDSSRHRRHRLASVTHWESVTGNLTLALVFAKPSFSSVHNNNSQTPFFLHKLQHILLVPCELAGAGSPSVSPTSLGSRPCRPPTVSSSKFLIQ